LAPFFAADPELKQAEIVRKLGEFWRGRVEAALDERGVSYDARDAALEARIVVEGAGRGRPGWIDPADCLRRARTLAAFRTDPRLLRPRDGERGRPADAREPPAAAERCARAVRAGLGPVARGGGGGDVMLRTLRAPAAVAMLAALAALPGPPALAQRFVPGEH